MRNCIKSRVTWPDLKADRVLSWRLDWRPSEVPSDLNCPKICWVQAACCWELVSIHFVGLVVVVGGRPGGGIVSSVLGGWGKSCGDGARPSQQGQEAQDLGWGTMPDEFNFFSLWTKLL